MNVWHPLSVLLGKIPRTIKDNFDDGSLCNVSCVVVKCVPPTFSVTTSLRHMSPAHLILAENAFSYQFNSLILSLGSTYCVIVFEVGAVALPFCLEDHDATGSGLVATAVHSLCTQGAATVHA
jgi:hypothetical protein